MFLKFIRDDKKIFTLGGSYKDTSSWGITKISGTGTISNDISKERFGDTDGEDVSGEYVPSRTIDITANVKSRSDNNSERQRAISFFNPKHSFKLYVTRDGVTRWINVKIEKFQCADENFSKLQTAKWALLCPDPYFYSVDNYGKNIGAIAGGFHFPYINQIGSAFIVGSYAFAKQVEIENIGDVDTYAVVRIESTGTVANPKIMNNGKYIRVIDVMEKGDCIEIDLLNNTIHKNGVNCIGKVDRSSSFTGMAVHPGDNTFSFSADSGETYMNVTLYYNLKYLGI